MMLGKQYPHRDNLNFDAYLTPYTKKSVQNRLNVKCRTRKYDEMVRSKHGRKLYNVSLRKDICV